MAITDAGGCVASPDTVAAGAVTFNVRNVDAVGVSEVELLSDQRIRGERENLAPGFDATFTATLDGGSYEIYCPGAACRPDAVHRHRRGRRHLRRHRRAAAAGHRRLRRLHRLAGRVPGRGRRHPADRDRRRRRDRGARAPTRRPARTTSGSSPSPSRSATSTRRSTCASATSSDPATWTGFHPIEKLLFEGGTTAGAETLAATLVTDIARAAVPDRGAAAPTPGPTPPATVTWSTRSPTAPSRCSARCRLQDHRRGGVLLQDRPARLPGQRRGFAAGLRRPEAGAEPDRPGPGHRRQRDQFDALLALLDTHRDPAAIGGFTLYDDLTDAQITALSHALSAVIEPLSTVPSKIATA